jgi:hypothetical protein
LRLANVTIRELRYFDVVGILPWFLFNTLMRRTSLSPGMMSLYDRYFVPTSRWLEGKLSLPVGKNLIVVATKD